VLPEHAVTPPAESCGAAANPLEKLLRQAAQQGAAPAGRAWRHRPGDETGRDDQTPKLTEERES
jgi:hypothetical protein